MPGKPLPIGSNGRGRDGKFQPGCAPGPGNPHGRAVNEWRKAIIKATSAAQVKRVWQQLVKAAESGERWAVCEYLDRTVGKAATYSDLELIGQVEELQEVIRAKFGQTNAGVGRRF